MLLALNNEMYWSKTDSQEEEWLLVELFIPRGTYEVKIFELKIYIEQNLIKLYYSLSSLRIVQNLEEHQVILRLMIFLLSQVIKIHIKHA